MPVYDYQCTECNSKYDVFHKGREVKEDVVCPSCGSVHHKKLMSLPVVSMGSRSISSDSSGSTSCDTEGCCGGACGLN
jgi:putative FmdB family regulatory protein